MKSSPVLLLSVLGTLLLSGCITHIVPVNYQVPSAAPDNPTKGPVSIVQVVDERIGGLEAPTVAAGAHRWIFEQTQTAGDVISAAIREGLARRGYQAQTGTGSPDTLVVHIKRYSVHSEMGMFTLIFLSDFSCQIDYTRAGKTGTFTVNGAGKNVCQLASSANCELAARNGLSDFLQNLDRELATAGF